MCVSAHALLSAFVARLEGDGADATAAELAAIVAAGCPRVDLEAALVRGNSSASARARRLLAETPTPERARRA